MKSLKKIIRLFALGLLIVLATFGVGMVGGVPISSNKKSENLNEIKIELVEIKGDKTELTEIHEFKQ